MEDSLQPRSQCQRESATSKTGRRQHRSCDQCRKGKRACDLVMLNNVGFRKGGYDAFPCSNCTKTRKTCTIEWLQTMHGISPRRQKKAGRMNPVLRQSQSSPETRVTEDLQEPPGVDSIASLEFYDEICKGMFIPKHIARCLPSRATTLCRGACGPL